jgi:hypothetical protein
MDDQDRPAAVIRLALQLFLEGLALCLTLTAVLWFLLG